MDRGVPRPGTEYGRLPEGRAFGPDSGADLRALPQDQRVELLQLGSGRGAAVLWHWPT